MIKYKTNQKGTNNQNNYYNHNDKMYQMIFDKLDLKKSSNENDSLKSPVDVSAPTTVSSAAMSYVISFASIG
jgi:hypothetical protein